MKLRSNYIGRAWWERCRSDCRRLGLTSCKWICINVTCRIWGVGWWASRYGCMVHVSRARACTAVDNYTRKCIITSADETSAVSVCVSSAQRQSGQVHVGRPPGCSVCLAIILMQPACSDCHLMHFTWAYYDSGTDLT